MPRNLNEIVRLWIRLLYSDPINIFSYTHTYNILTINVPVVYMAKEVMRLMPANTFRAPLEGVGPEMATSKAGGAILAQKKSKSRQRPWPLGCSDFDFFSHFEV